MKLSIPIQAFFFVSSMQAELILMKGQVCIASFKAYSEVKGAEIEKAQI